MSEILKIDLFVNVRYFVVNFLTFYVIVVSLCTLLGISIVEELKLLWVLVVLLS